MNEVSIMEKTFSFIINQMVETGQAPHFTEIAAKLEFPVEGGRKAVHDLFSAGIPGWVFPGTDYISSFAPFSSCDAIYRK